jgi:peptide-methionine (S)-S-oxide reductase
MEIKNRQIAIFGGGCFWCTEAVFEELRGVVSVMPGYSGGAVANPTYEQVSTGTTGHAEATRIEFDPAQISYHDLLTVFFATHDPTTRNRQGNDVGTQYRSAIFYTTPEQKDEAEKFIADLEASDLGGKPIVTEIVPFEAFYEAEDYHRQYFKNHPNAGYCQLIIEPKVEKLQKQFANLLKEKAK